MKTFTINPKLQSAIPVALTIAIWSTYSFTRTNNILIAAFGVYFMTLGWPYSPFQWRRDRLLLLPVLLFAAYFIGAFWSSDLKIAWHQLEKKLGFVAFPLMFFFGRNVLKPKDITTILYAFLVTCLGISLLCYAGALWNVIENGSFEVVGPKERPYYYFSYLPFVQVADAEPIYLSLYVNFCILILLFRPPKVTWLTIAGILYAIVFNVLVASKAGLIVTLVIFVLYAMGFVKNRALAFGLCVVVAVGCAVVVYTIPFLRERFLVSLKFDYDVPYAGEWNSTSQRLAIWSCVLETIWQRPILGHGTGEGQKALNRTYTEKNYIRGYEDKYNAHSEYLFTWLDLGLPGVLLLLYIIFQSVRYAHSAHDPLFLYLMVILSLYFVIEVVFARRAGINFFSFFYCLLAINDFTVRNNVLRHEV